jgi:hypothetical protein
VDGSTSIVESPITKIGDGIRSLAGRTHIGRRNTLEEQRKTEESSSRILTRRRFLQGTAVTAAGLVVAPSLVHAQNATPTAGQKLRIAFVGTGGRAEAHIGLSNSETCVAYCDVDEGRWGKIKEMAPNAAAYTDWRLMLDKHMNEIDALVVTTPDHSHALPSLRAMREGKHVYCEKPLTWSIEEARLMAEAAAKYKVATQMGNQGHANQGNRLVVEWIRDGAIGDVKEVHTWTNRPVWAQGNLQREPEAVPANLNWDAWIGPAQYRERHKTCTASAGAVGSTSAAAQSATWVATPGTRCTGP